MNPLLSVQNTARIITEQAAEFNIFPNRKDKKLSIQEKEVFFPPRYIKRAFKIIIRAKVKDAVRGR